MLRSSAYHVDFNVGQQDDCKLKDGKANIDAEEKRAAKSLRIICCMSLFILEAARPTNVYALFN